MKITRLLFGLLFVIIVSIFFPQCKEEADKKETEESVIIANRAAGSITVIDAKTDVVIDHIKLPGAAPEPMYVNYLDDRIFVGDRANKQVVVFDAKDFTVIGAVPCGQGVFHQWVDPKGKQLWVNNDIDKTATVIDPKSLQVLATVPMPADLSTGEAKPHDVVLSPDGKYAYVSIIKVAGDKDYVVQFSTSTFKETARAAVGKDPHLSANPVNNQLYVPCQGSNKVVILNLETLGEAGDLAISGAHGAGMSPDGKRFYTSNLPGGGTNALAVIKTSNNELAGMFSNTPYTSPHNLALNADATKLYVTHSSATLDKVTVYSVNESEPLPKLIKELSAQANPFGITYYKREK